MKNTNTTKLAIASLIAALATAAASFGDHHKKDDSKQARAHSKEGFMMEYDMDGDGSVSSEEFLAARVVSHQEKDMNGDGVVTEAEYVAEWEIRLDKQLAERREASVRQAHVRYGALDKDKNEDMTVEEFHASGNRTFTHYDTNGDGVVSKDDMKPEDRFGDLEQVAEDKKAKNKKKKKKKKAS